MDFKISVGEVVRVESGDCSIYTGDTYPIRAVVFRFGRGESIRTPSSEMLRKKVRIRLI